jgi:hypothetical protein
MRLESRFITNPDASQQEVLKVTINQNLVVKFYDSVKKYHK